jgi:hypothetical protein
MEENVMFKIYIKNIFWKKSKREKIKRRLDRK